jgi:type IV pilus assembly protein PilC
VPEFVCRVGTPAGDVRLETHAAADEATLRNELSRRDLHVFEIHPRRPGIGIGHIRIGGGTRRIGKRDFILFNQQMVALLKAGVPLLQALESTLERMPSGGFRRALTDVRDRVRAGASMSEGFQAQGEAFPTMYAAALTAGERSGELATVMARYLAFAKKTQMLRTKVVSALIYPAVLVGVSLLSVSALLFFSLPKFAEFYADFDSALPSYTQAIIDVTGWVRAHWILTLVTGVVAVLALRSWKATPSGRRALDRAVLKLPLLGNVARMYHVAQFSRTLATLVSGGIPLVPALQTTTGAMTNSLYIDAVREMTADVRQGRALWESMEKTGVMTDLAIELCKVGESTGSLDVMMTNIADFYDEQVDENMTRVVSVISPVIIVFMGFIVLMLLVAMYMPIFSLSGTSNM